MSKKVCVIGGEVMKIGQTLLRNGELYKIYKISDFKVYAESELGNIICLPNLFRIK